MDFITVSINLSISKEDHKRLERIAASLNEENKKYGENSQRYNWENVLKYFGSMPDYLNDIISTLEYNRGLISQDEWNHRQESYNARLEKWKQKQLVNF